MKNDITKTYEDFLDFMVDLKLNFPIAIKGSFSIFKNNKLDRIPNDIDISLSSKIDSLTTQKRWMKISK